jgi:hypothetical protein
VTIGSFLDVGHRLNPLGGLLAGYEQDETYRMVRVPVTAANWAKGRRYCESARRQEQLVRREEKTAAVEERRRAWNAHLRTWEGELRPASGESSSQRGWLPNQLRRRPRSGAMNAARVDRSGSTSTVTV